MKTKSNPSKNLFCAIVATVLSVAYYIWLISAWNWEGKKLSPSQEPSGGYTQPSRSATARPRGAPLPQYAYFIQQPRYNCDSSLTVKTARGSAYVIKVVDSYSGEVILSCYLPGGISQEIDIPSGTFEIRYTCGTEWFGDRELFGPTGSYAKAQGTFRFTRDAGYELTLYKVANGNLRTTTLRKEDF